MTYIREVTSATYKYFFSISKLLTKIKLKMNEENGSQNIIPVCKYNQTGYCQNGRLCNKTHSNTLYAKREFVETTIAFKDIQKNANILQTINHVLTKINVLMPTIGAKVM